jgi:hypothetical protein
MKHTNDSRDNGERYKGDDIKLDNTSSKKASGGGGGGCCGGKE